MSDAPKFESGHDACKEGGTAHIMNDVTQCWWPCGLQLIIKLRLGRVSFVDVLWEEHERWYEANGN